MNKTDKMNLTSVVAGSAILRRHNPKGMCPVAMLEVDLQTTQMDGSEQQMS